jgi:hypothetical protein
LIEKEKTMKITFEGETVFDIAVQMDLMLNQMGLFTRQVDPEPKQEPEHDPERAAPPAAEEEASPPKRGPGRPKKAAAPAEEPKTETEEPKTETEEPKTEEKPNFEALRSKAVSALMETYNKGGAEAAKVKAVLKEFGVAKFAEVPNERLGELLTRAHDLKAEVAA